MASQPSAEAPTKGGKKLPVLIACVLLLAGGGFVAFQKLRAKPEAEHVEKKPKPIPIDPGVLEPEPFILNLADPAGDRYVRVSMSLVLDQKWAVDRSKQGLADVKLRDRVLSVLARKKASQLTTNEGKNAVRAELRDALEDLLGEAPFFVEGTDPARAHVQDVLFKGFLVQ